MIHAAYKHLDSRLRIAELTIGQWIVIFGGVVLALLYAYFVHPFGATVTLVTAVYLGGLPVAAALLAGLSEFDVWLLMRSAVSWRRMDGRYLPGAGTPTPGYRVDDTANDWANVESRLVTLDVSSLWGER